MTDQERIAAEDQAAAEFEQHKDSAKSQVATMTRSGYVKPPLDAVREQLWRDVFFEHHRGSRGGMATFYADRAVIEFDQRFVKTL